MFLKKCAIDIFTCFALSLVENLVRINELCIAGEKCGWLNSILW